MKITITNKPCILLETVELFYAYVNRLPVSTLTSGGAYSIPVDVAEHMLAEVCGSYDPADPELLFFFRQEALLDSSGQYTCLARNLVRNILDFSSMDWDYSLSSLRQSWKSLRSKGERICSIQEYALEYETDHDDRGEMTLADEIEQLAVSADYRMKLLQAFSDYDAYLDRLSDLIHPKAQLLQDLLEPWVQRAEPLVGVWQEHYSQPGATEDLLRAVCFSDTVPLTSLSVCLRYFGDTIANGRMDDRTDSVSLHTGVARIPSVVITQEMMNWEYHAFRLLGSPARVKMLQAMRVRPMTLRGIAQELQLHLGTVGRDVASMHQARLLIVEPIDGRNFYRTNTETLSFLSQRLLFLQELPPEMVQKT
ncbi:MAG: winged helix-turn-helix transcriptional regulator [Ruminococcaceae bacterium]|nr:winged helix-turn-helix transcriptional regulator [Oscillospiraceae bacterium]